MLINSGSVKAFLSPIKCASVGYDSLLFHERNLTQFVLITYFIFAFLIFCCLFLPFSLPVSGHKPIFLAFTKHFSKQFSYQLTRLSTCQEVTPSWRWVVSYYNSMKGVSVNRNGEGCWRGVLEGGGCWRRALQLKLPAIKVYQLFRRAVEEQLNTLVSHLRYDCC